MLGSWPKASVSQVCDVLSASQIEDIGVGLGQDQWGESGMAQMPVALHLHGSGMLLVP